jgi:hypothetical protein
VTENRENVFDLDLIDRLSLEKVVEIEKELNRN